MFAMLQGWFMFNTDADDAALACFANIFVQPDGDVTFVNDHGYYGSESFEITGQISIE